MSFVIGTIYTTKGDEGYPKGTRVEYIGGLDDDCFTDGESLEYFSPEEVQRSADQSPVECSEYIQSAKSKAMSGYDPD